MKRKIYLQLFAEPAPEAGTDPDQSVPKPETSAPADPNPEDSKAKYTDDDLDRIINKKFAEWQKNGYIRNFRSFRWRAELLPDHFL